MPTMIEARRITTTRRGVYQGCAVADVGFKMPEANLLILRGPRDIVVAGLTPNAGKALAAQGLKPDIAIVYDRSQLNEIFFPCAISSAQQQKSVVVIVPSAEMKEAVEQYMLVAYRPLADEKDPYAKFNIDKAKLERPETSSAEQKDLADEIRYYDPKCERDLGKIINVVVVMEGEVQTCAIEGTEVRIQNIGRGKYLFNNKELDASRFSAVEFEESLVPDIGGWNPRFGIFMFGVNSGGYPKGFSTGFLARVKGKDSVIDCGPQAPRVLELAGVDLNEVSWIVTHTHPDHDAGIFELLRMGNVNRVELFTHIFAWEAIFKKAELMGLADVVVAKIPALQGKQGPWRAGEWDSPYLVRPEGAGTTIGLSDTNYSFTFSTIWGLHGIPTTMHHFSYAPHSDTRHYLTYTGDGALSEDRLTEIRSAGALSASRENRIRTVIAPPGLLIEEIGKGENHSTRPIGVKEGESSVLSEGFVRDPMGSRFVHWSNADGLPAQSVAQTFEVVNLS